MQTIYKYSLNITDSQVTSMPKDAQILTAQTQNDCLCLWALVDTEKPNTDRVIRIYGTGHPTCVDDFYYVSTVQTRGGFVWHIFEEINQ